MLGLWNLWLFFIPGYGLIWALMIWANRKRGKPIEDTDFYKMPNGRKCYVIGWIWLIAVFLVSLFTPINFGLLFWIGLPLFIIGILLNAIAMYSFARFTGGVNTTGIYRYSRHPMYIAGLFFLLGLCLIGWSTSVWSVVLLILFVLSVPFYHWTALLEEAFLVKKYGDSYHEYMNKTSRYVRILKKR